MTQELVGNALLRRITVRDVIGRAFMKELPAHLSKAPGKKLALMRILGVASRAKPGQTDRGEYIRFLGRFKATNLLTGEVFQSHQAILPNFIGEMIHAAMSSGGPGLSGLEAQNESQFAFDIGAVHEPTAVTQYIYQVTSLLQPAASDALTLLEQSLNLPQLALKAA